MADIALKEMLKRMEESRHFYPRMAAYTGISLGAHDLSYNSGRMAVYPASVVVAASDSRATSRADYYCTGDGDEETINSALSSLGSNGGRVLLLDGTYTLDDSIRLTNGADLRGCGWGTLLYGESESLIYHSTDNPENCRVSDLQLKSDDTQVGIEVGTDDRRLFVDNVRFYHVLDGVVMSDYGTMEGFWCTNSYFKSIADDALDVNRCKQFIASNNKFEDIGDNVIDTEQSRLGSITGNIVDTAGGHGIELEDEYAAGDYTGYISVVANTLYNVTGNAIHADSGLRCSITGNVIDTAAYGVYIGKNAASGLGGHLAISGNIFSNISGDGIKEESGEVSPSAITGNVFYSITGLAMRTTHGSTIVSGNLEV